MSVQTHYTLGGMMKSELFDSKKIELEVEKNEYLNSVFGLVCFTLALTCLGMGNPQKEALVCPLIIMPMLYDGYNHFPPEF